MTVNGHEPDPMTELYGSRAHDLCFMGAMADTSGPDGDDKVISFSSRTGTRMSDLATPSMVHSALTDHFGEYDWPVEILDNMIHLLHDDLRNGRKEEYSTKLGLSYLYERAGGVMLPQILDAVEEECELDKHPVIWFINTKWTSYQPENDDVGTMTYMEFYEAYLARFLTTFKSEDTRMALKVFDVDGDGYISQSEFVYRIKWVIKEHPDECSSLGSTLNCLFQKYVKIEILALQMKLKVAKVLDTKKSKGNSFLDGKELKGNIKLIHNAIVKGAFNKKSIPGSLV